MKIFNKIIFILIFTFLLIGINNFSFASESDESIITTTLPSIENIIKDDDNWFIYLSPKSNRYFLFVYGGHITYADIFSSGSHSLEDRHIPINIIENSDGNPRLYLCCGDSVNVYYMENNSWNLTQTYGSSEMNINYAFSFPILPYICASNFDLCNNEYFLGNNDLVFQESPTLSTLRGINFRPMVWETMRETILGYLKYLIIFLVSLIALYKGWQFLLTLLKGC